MHPVGPETTTLMLLDLAAQVMGCNGAKAESAAEMVSFFQYMYRVYSDWEEREKVVYPAPAVEIPPNLLN